MLYVGVIIFATGALLSIFASELLGRIGKGLPFVIMLLGVAISGISVYNENASNSKTPNYSSYSKTP